MSQTIVKIKYEWIHEVSWIIILLHMMHYFGISSEIQFLISVGLILGVIAIQKSICIPRIQGWFIYIISIIIMLAYGLVKNEMFEVEKGCFYIFNTFAMVILGYYLCRVEKNKSFEKTIYITAIIIMIKNWFTVLIDPTVLSNMQQLRDSLSAHIFDLMIMLIIIFYTCVIPKKILFGRRMDKTIVLFMTLTVLLSLGRTQIICFVLGVVTLYIVTIVKSDDPRYYIRSFIAILSVGIFVIILSINVLPQETVSPFLEKMGKSAEEVSGNNSFSSLESINNNWRGYENKNATEQWERANVYEEIFGQGIGKTIELIGVDGFIEQKYSLENKHSPILHSGYHTLLIKGGVLSIVGMLLWYIYPVIKLYRCKNRKKIELYTKLLAINIAMIFATYVVRGIISDSVFMAWALAMGWYSCKLSNY